MIPAFTFDLTFMVISLRELRANFLASLQVGLHFHGDLLQELSGSAEIPGGVRQNAVYLAIPNRCDDPRYAALLKLNVAVAGASLHVGLHFHDDLLQELSGLAESGGTSGPPHFYRHTFSPLPDID
jgi:hypothetical protein